LDNLTNMHGGMKIKKGTPTSRRMHGWNFAQLP